MEDEKIVELYWNRSENAIQETAAKYGSYCWKIAYNILSNYEDSEECVNDAYLKTWNSIPEHRPSLLSAYIGKITRNLSLNKYLRGRAQKRGGGQPELILEELNSCITASKSTETAYLEGMAAQAVSRFLNTSKLEYRIIFVRRYWYSDSILDIAKRYGISESRVKSILHRMRGKLRIFLEKEGIVL